MWNPLGQIAQPSALAPFGATTQGQRVGRPPGMADADGSQSAMQAWRGQRPGRPDLRAMFAAEFPGGMPGGIPGGQGWRDWAQQQPQGALSGFMQPYMDWQTQMQDWRSARPSRGGF